MAEAAKRVLIDEIIARIRRVCPERGQAYPLHEPKFRGAEWERVRECLDTGWVSSVGKYVDQFERQLEAYTGVTRAVACVNGTSALHVCLMLLGVRPGDEVLAPALTFVATANSIAYCSATPHFVDSEVSTLGADAAKLREYLAGICISRSGQAINRITERPIKAFIAMHTFGCPSDLDGLSLVCREFGIPLVEDAAESIGSFYKGKHTGSLGILSALSFNGNKIITTGGGGAVLTNDPELGAKAKHLTTTARIQAPSAAAFFHDQVGYNYRLPNLNAALGCAQLEQLPELLEKKRAIAGRYIEAFSDLSSCTIHREPNFARSNYWLITLLLGAPDTQLRDEIVAATNAAGLATRPAWTLMHKLPMYRDCPRMDLSVAEALEARIINLPSSPSLMDISL